MSSRRLLSSLLLVVLGLLGSGVTMSSAQEFRIDVGGGWAVPTNNVEAETAENYGGESPLLLSIDLKPGPHAYAGVGFVRSIGDNFALGARIRAQTTRLRTSVDACDTDQCSNPEGTLRAGTLEGRVILTSPDWIHPYLLVGLGVVRASIESVTVDGIESPELPPTLTFQEVAVTDAGGDVGLGATFPLVGGLDLDAEFRVTGALPGGKENAVTVLPFTVGLAYGF